MAFEHVPSSERPNLIMRGNSIELNDFKNGRESPEAIHLLLTERLGWIQSVTHPDTYERLYKKDDNGPDHNGQHINLTNNYHYTWSEAMAYEFAKFLNIGLDS